MTTLHHAIRIAAPRAQVFRALTDPAELRLWHLGEISGDTGPDQVLTLAPRPGLSFSWRTERLEADRLLVQRCVAGAGQSVGKQLTFRLSDLPEAQTLVELSDAGWQADDPHLPRCNTHWGDVLHRLQTYLQTR